MLFRSIIHCLALEPRVATRWDIHRYARRAYEMGIRYIGGCCGFEPYHIRAVAEELSEERGRMPAGSEKHGPWGYGLKMHTKPWVRARAVREYWENLQPATGRPYSASMSKPDSWGITKVTVSLTKVNVVTESCLPHVKTKFAVVYRDTTSFSSRRKRDRKSVV